MCMCWRYTRYRMCRTVRYVLRRQRDNFEMPRKSNCLPTREALGEKKGDNEETVRSLQCRQRTDNVICAERNDTLLYRVKNETGYIFGDTPSTKDDISGRV